MNWEKVKPGKYRCTLCGRVFPLTEQELRGKVYHRCSTSCDHRGDQIREANCKSCNGNVRIKVFACAIWGQCHLAGKQIEGVHACLSCEDRISS